MKINREKIIVSILEESPIYSDLQADEKRVLIEELIRAYPYLFKEGHENIKFWDR